VALALCVASASLNFAVPRTLAVMGEVGLAGELRAVSGLTRGFARAQRLGATRRAGALCEGELEDVPGVTVPSLDGTLAEAIVVGPIRHDLSKVW
jgi:DNA repair protein RadA/Sms